jgi:predicted nucleic acid-binding protein
MPRCPKIPKITHLKEFSSFPKEEKFPIIGFDTSFVVKTLVEGLDYHEECMDFIEALRNAAPQPIIVFSELLRAELWHANLLVEISRIFKTDAPSEILKTHPRLPRNYYEKTLEIDKNFYALLGGFTYWQSIPISNEITSAAIKLTEKYNLLSYDAVHIATMFKNGIEKVLNIVAFDKHIEDIQDLVIWTVDGRERYIKHHYKDWGFKKEPSI